MKYVRNIDKFAFCRVRNVPCCLVLTLKAAAGLVQRFVPLQQLCIRTNNYTYTAPCSPPAALQQNKLLHLYSALFPSSSSATEQLHLYSALSTPAAPQQNNYTYTALCSPPAALQQNKQLHLYSA